MNRSIAIGFYFITALIVLGVTTVLVGHLPIFSSSVEIQVVFDQIEGLRRGDNVRVDGAALGKVTDVEVVDAGILVRARLDHEIDVCEKPEITVDFLSILGGNHLSIRRGFGPGVKMVKISELSKAGVLKGLKKPSVLDEATAVLRDNREDVRVIISGLKETLTSIKENKGLVGKLINDPEMARKVEKAVDDMPQITESAKNMLQKVERGEGNLGKLLNDEELYNDLRHITKQLKGTDSVAGKLLNDPEMGKKLEKTVSDMSDTLASAKQIFGKFEKGEGTIGRLVQDDSIIKEAEEAIRVFGKAARSRVYLGGEYLVGAESEMGIVKAGIRIWPDDNKFFYLGASALMLDKEGDVAYERLFEQNENDTIVKADIQIGYNFDWLLDRRLTARVGMLEGQPGGALEFRWDDFGLFHHPVTAVFETRQAYNDLDDDDIDEGVGKTLQRAYVSFPLWGVPAKDQKLEWWQQALRWTKVTVGGSRLLDDDPEFFAGIGFAYEDEDIRTLVGLIGAAR